jgi:nifR3 family TIM-barrel protein
MNLWEDIKKPIFVLAPMADVTDAAFRRVIAKYGKPDVMWTEFVSADGLVRAPESGRKKLLLDLMYAEAERPIVAQFFTANPEHMREAAKLARELGFNGIDINMGCPDRSIEKQGAGAALIKEPKLARELIRSAKEGARGLPVSVKTRVGYNRDELDEWLPEILKEEPALVTVHARTRKEMSKVPARWELVKRSVDIRNAMGVTTLILGNGDVADIGDAKRKVAETGADGAMLGRAIFGNPFLFSREKCPEGIEGLELRLRVMVEHTKLFEELLGHAKSFAIMKKHYKAYVSGFEGSADLRADLMNAENSGEVEKLVDTFLSRSSI